MRHQLRNGQPELLPTLSIIAITKPLRSHTWPVEEGIPAGHVRGGWEGFSPNPLQTLRKHHTFLLLQTLFREESELQTKLLKEATGSAEPSGSPSCTCSGHRGAVWGHLGATGLVLQKAPGFGEAPFPGAVRGSAAAEPLACPTTCPEPSTFRLPRLGGFTMTGDWLPSARQRPVAGATT